jgi:transposase InsO family protein
MPWKTMDVREQRVNFVVTARRGEKPLSVLCEEFGISRPTGYLWLSRYTADGVLGIVERSRRPLLSPLRTSPDLEARVVALRLRYPDWGARKLQVMLARQGGELTHGTIHRVLLRHGLVAGGAGREAAPQRFERSRPNELWQMDFKGPMEPGTRVGPLSVIDDHSRYLLVLQRLADSSAELVRKHLQNAFCCCGVPEGMLMDHGTPWWSAQSPSGFTALSLWLMKQGIALHWGRIRHPQTQGKVERFHGELQRAFRYRHPAAGQDMQAWLDTIRREHNHVRPHEALEMATPDSRWQPSARPYQAAPPEWEYPEDSWVLKVDSDGKIKLKGEHWLVSRALRGERVQLVTDEQRVLVYYCRTLVREFDLASQRSTIVERWLEAKDSTTETVKDVP